MRTVSELISDKGSLSRGWNGWRILNGSKDAVVSQRAWCRNQCPTSLKTISTRVESATLPSNYSAVGE